MKTVRAAAAAALMLAVAACGPADEEPSAAVGPDNGTTAPDVPDEVAGETLADWRAVFDAELPDVTTEPVWDDTHEMSVAAMCGPADEYEGLQALAALHTGADADTDDPDSAELDPPDDAWEATNHDDDGNVTAWRHREHDRLTMFVRDGYVEVAAASPGATWDEFTADGLPDHPPPLDPDTGEPALYCG